MERYSKEEFFKLLDNNVHEAGSQRKLAKKLNVSHVYLRSVLNQSLPPSDRLLNAMNLRKVVIYESLDGSEKEEKE